MKIVIIGAGKVGFRVAERLAQDKHDIVLVEKNHDYATYAEENLDAIVIRGNGALPAVLTKAGIAQESEKLPDMLIAVTNSDEVNIMASLVAKQIGVKSILARAVSVDFEDAEIVDTNWAKALGIEMFITPEKVVAREITNLLEVKGALRVSELAGGRALIHSFEITGDSAVVNKNLIEIRKENPNLAMLVVTIKRGDASFVPTAEEKLLEGDYVSVVCHKRDKRELERLFQKEEEQPRALKRIFIVGGGRVGTRLAMLLHERYPRSEIKLVERDAELCRSLSAKLDGVTVLCSSGRDSLLLSSEGVENADGFVATTGEDEKNLVLAALAHSMGAAKAIALVSYEGYLGMPEVIPVDSVVDKNQALASIITQHVRYPNSKEIVNLISDLETETMELKIARDAIVCGKTFAKIRMPRGTVVGLLVRDSELTIPSGAIEIKAGDDLVIIGSKSAMPRAVKLFTEKV